MRSTSILAAMMLGLAASMGEDRSLRYDGNSFHSSPTGPSQVGGFRSRSPSTFRTRAGGQMQEFRRKKARNRKGYRK